MLSHLVARARRRARAADAGAEARLPAGEARPGPRLRDDRRPQQQPDHHRLAGEEDRLGDGRPPRPRRRVLHARLHVDLDERGVQPDDGADRPPQRTASSGRTGTPACAARRPATSRTRTTRTCSRTGSFRSPTSRTAASSASTARTGRARDRARGQLRARPAARALARRTARRRCPTAACSSPRSAAGSTASTRAGSSSTRCARRRRTRPTRSCSRTGTSSSPASTRRAASTRSRRRAGSSGRTRRRGTWSLDRPSLAVRWPNGMIAITDDWHHRVLVVDPRTKKVVWSYGHLNQPSIAPGYLNKPDGLDLLPGRPGRGQGRAEDDRATRASRGRHAAAGAREGVGGRAPGREAPRARRRGRRRRRPTRSCSGRPRGCGASGRLPAPTHDAAAVLLGGRVSSSAAARRCRRDAVVRVDPATGRALAGGTLDEPLSDLGAVTIGGKAYLVGGYTGSTFASAILRYRRRQDDDRRTAAGRHAVRGRRRARRLDRRRRRAHDGRRDGGRVRRRPERRTGPPHRRRCRRRTLTPAWSRSAAPSTSSAAARC